jgi:flavin-dependent dehydrogenase
MYDAVIIGGGLAGLTSGTLLAQQGYQPVVLEKHTYPAHKVCGEYVSQEVIPLLENIGLWPFPFHTPLIDRVRMTTPSGKAVTEQLDLGGFGISRYQFDDQFARKARAMGAAVHEGVKVQGVTYHPEADYFTVQTHKGAYQARLVLGNFGKRSVMDRYLKRAFLQKPSPYIGVKHHILTDAPADEIALHSFPRGYCGLSQVEEGRYSLCYLARREALKAAGGVQQLEEQYLSQNPYLRQVFQEATFCWNKPMVINEISFEQKSLVDNHILTSGDAAGMIAPLCGNGMAMAIRGSQLLVEHVTPFLEGRQPRHQMEQQYARAWRKQFKTRLKTGKTLQDYGFGRQRLSDWAVNLFRYLPALRKGLIKQTHGRPYRA